MNFHHGDKQRGKCMVCRRKCNIRFVPCFLSCNHYYCCLCYRDKSINNTLCGICSPETFTDNITAYKGKHIVKQLLIQQEVMDNVRDYIESLPDPPENQDEAVKIIVHEVKKVEPEKPEKEPVEIEELTEEDKEMAQKLAKRLVKIVDSKNRKATQSSDISAILKLDVDRTLNYLTSESELDPSELYCEVEEQGERKELKIIAGNESKKLETSDSEDSDIETSTITEPRNENIRILYVNNKKWKIHIKPDEVSENEEEKEEDDDDKSEVNSVDTVINMYERKSIEKNKTILENKKTEQQTNFKKNEKELQYISTYNAVVEVPLAEQRTEQWKKELYTDDEPQPKEQLELQIQYVVGFMERIYLKNREMIGETESLKNVNLVLHRLTISEECKKEAIRHFEENHSVVIPNDENEDFFD